MRSVVWLKRDLRLHDHRPLAEAAAGKYNGLYFAEPSLWDAPHVDDCHDLLTRQSLRDIPGRTKSPQVKQNQRLRKRAQPPRRLPRRREDTA